MTTTTAVPQLLLPGQAAAPEGPIDLAPMYVMHRAFRRDVDAFVAVVPDVVVGDARRWSDLARRFSLFARIVHKHHHGEDVGLWPLLVERGAPPDVVAALEAEHVELASALDAVQDELRPLAARSADPAAPERVGLSLVRLRDVLDAHLAHEERDGMALVQQHLTPEDWHRLDEEVFSKDYGPKEVPTVLGWVASGLPDDVLARIPGGDSAAFRAFARAMAWWTDRRDARTFGPKVVLRRDRFFVQLSKHLGATHVRVLRATQWRVGARWMGGDVLLLTHVGRRSGERHTTPLLHVRDGEDLVVAASNGGIDREPQWWLNLQAHPEATVEVDGRTTPVVASAVGPDDRQRLWDALMAKCSSYDGYQASVSREISLVRLSPAAGPRTADR